MANRNETSLTVTGIGKVLVAPDEAIVRLSILTEGKTADEAVASNAEQTQAVIDAVSKEPNHGVVTSGLSVYPIIDYKPDSSMGTIVGFRASNGVEVTTKVGYVGKIYDVGIAAGANQSSGITFRVQNEAPYREEALRLAVGEALKEAKIVAKAADVELAGVESIQVDPGEGVIFFRTDAINAKSQTTPVIPERQTITARVMVQLHTRDRFDARQGQGQGKMERDAREPKARSPGAA
jgi:uncharacterized protein YggE